MSAATAWLQSLPGVQRDHPLAPHTTYRIGGPADWYLEAVDGYEALVTGCLERSVPLTMLGNGSNLLIADAGIAGLVVRTSDSAIRVRGDIAHAAAGARMVKVAQAAEKAGLTGFEWALGIPGMVGGSVHNNAGCFGSDIASTVATVHGVGPDGRPAGWTAEQCAFAYRTSAIRDGALRGGVVTGADFQLQPGDPETIRSRMELIQESRRRTQPVTGRSTGSVFKNPPGDFAGRLVDAAGLKGRAIGGAMVSREHANFIVNSGGASAADVAALVALVQAIVEERSGVKLEPEIQVLGRWPGGVPDAFLAGVGA
ncbi:MAG: UDP-N-acetylmuramate dehydrogenase [Chloroflexota bacterium]|jgi:UDP-N-acetylmuramate dehydrogenase|nr:UDP-N-acetylmuramate dehydrogenase [Chloroflexota bacterium]